MKRGRDFVTGIEFEDEPCPHCGGTIDAEGYCRDCGAFPSFADATEDADCVEFMRERTDERLSRGFLSAHSGER